jgi:hypothetical protein
MEGQSVATATLGNPGKVSRRRKRLRWLAVPATAAILALANYLTRTPELVWWKTPKNAPPGYYVKLLIPIGWVASPAKFTSRIRGYWEETYEVKRQDRVPSIVRRLFRIPADNDRLTIILGHDFENHNRGSHSVFRVHGLDNELRRNIERSATAATCEGVFGAYKLFELEYVREDTDALDRTCRQICESVTMK